MELCGAEVDRVVVDRVVAEVGRVVVEVDRVVCSCVVCVWKYLCVVCEKFLGALLCVFFACS